jgi:hypothetical protein
LVVVVVLDDGVLLGVLDDVVELVLLEPGVVLLVVPLGVVVVVVLDVSVDGVVGVVVVLLVVVDEELLPVAGAAVGAAEGVTSTLVLEDDVGGVVVSVFVQPTTPTPTARRAARRYDGVIVGFPSFRWLSREPLARADRAAVQDSPFGQPAIVQKSAEQRSKAKYSPECARLGKFPDFAETLRDRHRIGR